MDIENKSLKESIILLNSQVENLIVESKLLKEFKEKYEKERKIKKKSTKRKTIPKALRNKVWTEYNGETYKGQCFCCSREIDNQNFECGHVDSVDKGGLNTLDNLRPICKSCNTSMKTENMFEFMDKYGFRKSIKCIDCKQKTFNNKRCEKCRDISSHCKTCIDCKQLFRIITLNKYDGIHCGKCYGK
jgi:hypothetical protein